MVQARQGQVGVWPAEVVHGKRLVGYTWITHMHGGVLVPLSWKNLVI